MNDRAAAMVIMVTLFLAGCHPPAPTSAAPDGAKSSRVELCSGFIRKTEGYLCVDPMTAEQASHRTSYTKLTFEHGRMVRGDFLLGGGGLMTNSDGDVAWTLTYDDVGHTLTWLDRAGNVSALTRVEGNKTTVRTAWGAPKREKASDGFVTVMSFDGRGRLSGVKYYDEHDRPASRRGHHEVRYTRDDGGHAVETAYFDVAGRPATDPDGNHRKRDRVATLGCIDRWEYFDAEGKPYGGAQGVARGVGACDAWGNRVSMRWVDESGAPVINRQGIHGWSEKLDARGAVFEHLTVGVDGKPAPANGQEAIRRQRHDARGYLIGIGYLDANGVPFRTVEGHAGRRFLVDARGLTLEEQSLDENGALSNAKGIAVTRHQYDEKGRVSSTSFFDASGAPAMRWAGEASLVYQRDANGLVAAVSYRGVDGRPTLGTRGYAQERYVHDAEGRVTAHQHFDGGGQRVLLRGLRTMTFSYTGTKSQRPAAISREEAEKRASLALDRLRRGDTWEAVGRSLGEYPASDPTFASKEWWFEPIWQAGEKLDVGAAPMIIDTERGFIIVERKE